MVPERVPDLRRSPGARRVGHTQRAWPGPRSGRRGECVCADWQVELSSECLSFLREVGERGHPRGGRVARVQSCSGGPASLGAAPRARLGFTVMSSKQPCSAAPVQACRPWRGHSGFIHKCRIPCPSLGVSRHGQGQRGGPVPGAQGWMEGESEHTGKRAGSRGHPEENSRGEAAPLFSTPRVSVHADLKAPEDLGGAL